MSPLLARSISPGSGLQWNAYARYLLVAITVVTICDWCFLLQTELRYIWKRLPWFLRVAYAVSRYGVLVILSLFIMMCMPQNNLSEHICTSSMLVIGVMYFLCDTTGNLLTVFRVFMLWNRDKRVFKLLTLGSACACSTGLAFLFAAAKRLQVTGPDDVPSNLVGEYYRSCHLDKGSFYIIGTYASEALFEIYAFILVLCNAASIPRRQDQALHVMLIDHGAPLMAIVFALRLLDITLSPIGTETTFMFGIMISTPIIAMLNARIIIKISRHCEQSEQAWMAEGINSEREDP